MEIPIIGFDCEWVNLNGNTQQVSLIQLATCKGICALSLFIYLLYIYTSVIIFSHTNTDSHFHNF